MADTPDLSKIIGLIMENPDLITRIQGLVKSENKEPVNSTVTEPVPTLAEPTEEQTEKKAQTVSKDYYDPRQKRSKLLYAMKPYLSQERAKAIDSMLSVAEILDMMKSR